MWVKFDSIEQKKGLISARTGNSYDAWVVKGMKQGFQGEADEPYEKIFFDNSTTTIEEYGIERPGQSIVQFFQKAVNPGDTVNFTFERKGKLWEITKLGKLGEGKGGNSVPEYEPLTREQAEKIKYQQTQGVNLRSEGSETNLPWAKPA